MVFRRAKVDANQKDIVAALRLAGCSVTSLATVGKGCPDLLVGYEGQNYLLEVKGPRGVLTPDQEDWHGDWCGSVSIVRDVEQALNAVGLR